MAKAEALPSLGLPGWALAAIAAWVIMFPKSISAFFSISTQAQGLRSKLRVSLSVVAWDPLPALDTCPRQLSCVTCGYTEPECLPVLHEVVCKSHGSTSGSNPVSLLLAVSWTCAVAPDARVLHVRPVPTVELYPSCLIL